MLFKSNALRQHPLFPMKKVSVGIFLLALTALFVRGQRVVISPIVPGGGGGGISISDVYSVALWTNVGAEITTITSAPVIIHTTNLDNTFAYGLHFRKRGTTGDATAAITTGSELGNMFWSGWDGTGYRQGGLIVTKSDQAFTATEAMTHMEFRFVPTNSGTYSEFFRMTTAPGAGGSQTNPMLTFQGVTSVSAGIKRHARGLHIRAADDSGWADLAAGNVAFGTNQTNLAAFSSIGGGSDNTIDVFSPWSVISGGRSNWIQWGTNGGFFIGGGQSNRISGTGSLQCSNGVIVGGRENHIEGGAMMFIGGGYQNKILDDSGANPNGSVVVGGYNNTNQSTGGFMGAGSGNKLGASSADQAAIVAGLNNDNQGADYGFQGAGANNILNGGSTYGVMVGGQFHQANSPHSFIGGGLGNHIDTGSSDIGNSILAGVSNAFIEAGMMYSTIIGNWGTNRTPRSILLSPMGKIAGSNELHITATATTNTGPFRVRAGLSSTYASVGGTLTNATAAIGSAGTGATNLQTYTYLAHTLTNTGDRLIIRASGKFSPVADAKQIKLLFGSETVFDSGSQTANAGAWVIEAEIIRTGATAQAVNASYSGTGATVFNLANSLDIAQTNGINTLLAINVTCAANGGVTNRTLTVTYYPANP